MPYDVFVPKRTTHRLALRRRKRRIELRLPALHDRGDPYRVREEFDSVGPNECRLSVSEARALAGSF